MLQGMPQPLPWGGCSILNSNHMIGGIGNSKSIWIIGGKAFGSIQDDLVNMEHTILLCMSLFLTAEAHTITLIGSYSTDQFVVQIHSEQHGASDRGVHQSLSLLLNSYHMIGGIGNSKSMGIIGGTAFGSTYDDHVTMGHTVFMCASWFLFTQQLPPS